MFVNSESALYNEATNLFILVVKKLRKTNSSSFLTEQKKFQAEYDKAYGPERKLQVCKQWLEDK
jgi:hypothetical protein